MKRSPQNLHAPALLLFTVAIGLWTQFISASAIAAAPPLTCTEASMVSDVCAGPWSYQVAVAPCYAEKPSWSCPGSYDIPPRYYTCADPSFGVQSYTKSTIAVTGHATFTPGQCQRLEAGGRLFCDPSYCDQSVINITAAAEAAVQKLGGSDWSQGACSATSGAPSCNVTCNITVFHIPVYNQHAAYPCPIATFRVSNEATCRIADNGPAASPLECGPAAQVLDSATLLTASGLQQAVSPSLLYTSSCETCDNLPLTSAADARAKHDCLAASEARLQVATDPTYFNRVVATAKALLKLRGADLSSAQQVFTLQLFRDYPSVADSCAVDWVRPAGPFTCSDADRQQIDGALTLCNELGESNIQPDARADFVEYCTDAVRGMPGLVNCEGYYQAYVDAMSNLEVVMQSSLIAGDARTQALILKVHAAAVPVSQQ